MSNYDGVWREFDKVLGIKLLGCLHLNDSLTPFGARRDRHALVSEGTIGAEVFRRVMRDPRFAGVPKVIETPKGDDGVTNDVKSIKLLRRWRG